MLQREALLVLCIGVAADLKNHLESIENELHVVKILGLKILKISKWLFVNKQRVSLANKLI